MPFYDFTQNNTGGSFIVDDKVTHRVYIEAPDEKVATQIAESFGIYFDGVEKGWDCDCCGDRWHGCSEMDHKFPLEYGTIIFNTLEDYVQYLTDNYGWETPDARIFYANGTVREFRKGSNNPRN